MSHLTADDVDWMIAELEYTVPCQEHDCFSQWKLPASYIVTTRCGCSLLVCHDCAAQMMGWLAFYADHPIIVRCPLCQVITDTVAGKFLTVMPL